MIVSIMFENQHSSFENKKLNLILYYKKHDKKYHKNFNNFIFNNKSHFNQHE